MRKILHPPEILIRHTRMKCIKTRLKIGTVHGFFFRKYIILYYNEMCEKPKENIEVKLSCFITVITFLTLKTFVFVRPP